MAVAVRAGRRGRAGDTRGTRRRGRHSADAAVVFEELGRGLVPTPLLGHHAGRAGAAGRRRAGRRHLGAARRGAAIGAVVFDPTTWSTATSPTSSSAPTTASYPVDRLHRRARRPDGPDPQAGPRPPGTPHRSARIPGSPTPRQSCWRPNRSAPPPLPGTDGRLYQGRVSNSAGRSAASRRSSTGWRISTSWCSRQGRRRRCRRRAVADIGRAGARPRQ